MVIHGIENMQARTRIGNIIAGRFASTDRELTPSRARNDDGDALGPTPTSGGGDGVGGVGGGGSDTILCR